MNHVGTLSPALQQKLVQFADLLERVVDVARDLSRVTPVTPHIPVLKRPAHVPKDEEWFWTEEWQAGEREVDEALARGEYKDFESVEDLIADLHAHV